MRDVVVIGAGMTKFGESWDKSIKDIFVKAALEAIKDAGVDHIDSLYVGAMSAGLFVGQEHLGDQKADGEKNQAPYEALHDLVDPRRWVVERSP